MKDKMQKILFVVVGVVVFSVAGFARGDLANRVNAIISQKSQKKVEFGICIVKADSGKNVYRHNANRAMIPASNMKVIVTAVALKYLGADFEYKTRVGLRGETLVVIGSGDPLLGDKKTDEKYHRSAGWIFKDISEKLKGRGVRQVEDIIIDSSVFDDKRVNENWPVAQLNRWYAAEVSGLNYNDNCIDITVSNEGGRAVVSFEPKTDYSPYRITL